VAQAGKDKVTLVTDRAVILAELVKQLEPAGLQILIVQGH
jgi:hypothetical protein